MTREEHEKIVFGVRELSRRECLKASVMLKTPWLLGHAAPADAPSQSKSRRPAARPADRGRRRAAVRG